MKPCKVCNEFHLGCEDWGCWRDAGAAGMVREAIAPKGYKWTGEVDMSLAPIHVRGLGPARTGAASMVQDAIAKEREPKERKLNKVNLIVGAALFVGVVALLLGVANGY